MKRIAMATFAALLLLCGCYSGGRPQGTRPSQSLPAETPPQSAATPELDATQTGYTIEYAYYSGWTMQQEKDGDIRYTYYLIEGDINNQSILSVAEILLADGEDIFSPTTKQQLFYELQLGNTIEQSNTVQLFGEDALEVEFTQNPGNTTLNGLMYVFQWRGYAYAFSYLGGRLQQGDRQLLDDVLAGVRLMDY